MAEEQQKCYYVLPTPQQSFNSIGISNCKSEETKKWLNPLNDFISLAPQEPNDWLSKTQESGQSFSNFQKKNKLAFGRDQVIDLIILGSFPPSHSPSVDLLRDLCEIYFQVPIRIIERIEFEEIDNDFGVIIQLPNQKKKHIIRTRIHEKLKRKQLKTEDIFSIFKQIKRKEAFCSLIITIYDLYPTGRGNSVVGEASVEDSIGVFSFFKKVPTVTRALTKEEHGLLLLRSFKIIVHELIHNFGIDHCIYYDCVMCGTNTIKEADRFPSILCPVDLHKIKAIMGDSFNIENHYLSLYNAYKALTGFEKETLWLFQRLKNILGETELELKLKQFKPKLDIQNPIIIFEVLPDDFNHSFFHHNEEEIETQSHLEKEIVRLSIVVKVALKNGIISNQKSILVYRGDLHDLFKQAQNKFKLKKIPSQAFLSTSPDQPLLNLNNVKDSSLLLIK